MRNILAIVTLLAGCSTSDSTADLTCLGELAAGTPTSQAAGFVADEAGGAPIAGAVVEVRRTTDGMLLAATGTDDDGAYAMSIPDTNGLMRFGFAAGYLDGIAYDPMIETESLPLPLITEADADRLAALAGVTRDRSRGMVLVIPRDCAGTPLAGATVRIAGAHDALYLRADTKFDASLTTTSRDSAALMFDVPAGPVDIVIAIDGVEIHQTVDVRPNTLVTTWPQP